MSGTILYKDFEFYPGAFYELNPVELPVTTLLMAKGVQIKPNKQYNYTFHENPDMVSVTPNTKGDFASVSYGSTGFTTGSNVMNVWFEGAAQTWARDGDQGLGRVRAYQDPKNPSFEPDAKTRAMAEALLRIKTQAEYIGREGLFFDPNGGGTGTFQQRGYRYAPDITNQAAAGAVGGGSAVGSFGTLTRKVLIDTMQTLWENKINKGDQLYLITNSRAKRQISDIFKDEFNAGLNNTSLTESGVNIESFLTDFGLCKIILTHTLPADQVYILNLAQMGMVGRPVPGRGLIFEKEIPTERAGDLTGIYTEMGLDHGHGKMHARIYGIGTAPGHVTTGTIQTK